MSRTIVVRGRVVGGGMVQLDEPLPEKAREVEVRAELLDEQGEARRGTLSDYLRALPPGTCSKVEIDQRMREERDSWSR